MLLLNNEVISEVLDMGMTMDALEQSYIAIARGNAICRPRIDMCFPTSDLDREYRWGTMEGGATGGYFAIRMKSDILYHQTAPDGTRTREKYCGKPGMFCGLIFLTSTETGMPLALINDGVLQHMRVGGDGGLGVKHMARDDAEVVGMLGSGGMAETHMQSFCQARPIKRLQVYSPTKSNRDDFAARMAECHQIEAVACESPEEIYKGAHIVAALTDATRPVLNGALIEPGTHVVNIGGGGLPDVATIARVDVYLRMGDAPAAEGLEAFDDEYLSWRATGNDPVPKNAARAHGNMLPTIRVTLNELIEESMPGRTSDDQITWSERGNLQGAQFYAVAGRAYEEAKKRKLGREIPDDWILQTIRN